MLLDFLNKLLKKAFYKMEPSISLDNRMRQSRLVVILRQNRLVITSICCKNLDLI